jgi:predicted dehydrogenase
MHRSLAARVMRRLVRCGAIGELSHIYCDLDDGPIHRMRPEQWLSPRGVPWQVHDEFRTGPVVHHLPYALNWAVLLAGPVVSTTGFTRTSIPVKSVDGPVLLGDNEVLRPQRSWPYHSTHRLNLVQGLRDLALSHVAEGSAARGY